MKSIVLAVLLSQLTPFFVVPLFGGEADSPPPPSLQEQLARLKERRSPAVSIPATDDGFLIPIVGNVQGGQGTHFKTDLTIFNESDRTEEVLFTFIPGPNASGSIAPLSRKMTLEPYSYYTFEDIVGSRFGITGFGALLVLPEFDDGDVSLHGNARIYTQQPGSSGFVSQSTDGLYPFPLHSKSAAFIAGLRSDSRFRTNVGIINPESREATWRVFGPSSSGIDMTITVPAESMVQVPVNGSTSNGHLLLSIFPVRGVGYWAAYASSVDNVTGDGWTNSAVDGWYHNLR